MRIQAIMRIKNGRMAEARKRLGLSQMALSKLCECSPTLINQIENLHLAQVNPDSAAIIKIASVLCLPTDSIAPHGLCGKELKTRFKQTADVEVSALLLYAKNRVEQQTLPSPTDQVEHEDLTEYFMGLLAKNMHRLTSYQQEVITLKYGLNGETPVRNSDIARLYKKTPESVRMCLNASLRKIKDFFDAETRLLETKSYV